VYNQEFLAEKYLEKVMLLMLKEVF